MSLIDLLSFIVAVFVLSMKPGPGMVAFVSRTLKDGMAPAWAMFTGSLMAEVIYLSVAIFALSFVGSYLVWIAMPLKVCGAAYLFWIGFQGLREHAKLSITQDVVSRDSLGRDFTAGLFLGLGNPLIIVFYAALLPMVLDVGALSVTGVLLTYLVITVVHVICGSVQIVGADMMRQFFDTPRRVQMVGQMASIAMMLVAIYILTSGIQDASTILHGRSALS